MSLSPICRSEVDVAEQPSASRASCGLRRLLSVTQPSPRVSPSSGWKDLGHCWEHSLDLTLRETRDKRQDCRVLRSRTRSGTHCFHLHPVDDTQHSESLRGLISSARGQNSTWWGRGEWPDGVYSSVPDEASYGCLHGLCYGVNLTLIGHVSLKPISPRADRYQCSHQLVLGSCGPRTDNFLRQSPA